ncbi:MAG: S-layer homology domain-containing protein [Oscillospiraceae bacterium]|nr:S-layer homology domain-containing protein [Oscillospiraceae bacterium]
MKRIFSLFLALTLCAALSLPAGAVFPDTPDPDVHAAAALLQNLGVVAGYNDGGFHPNDTLTRAQFCKMAMLLSGPDDAAAHTGYTIFPDVKADHWARGYINAAVRTRKIISGFPDGTFRPDVPVSFPQAVTILVRLLGYGDEDVGLDWPSSYLDKAALLGLTRGLPAGRDEIDRGLGARLFSNTLFAQDKDGNPFGARLGLTEHKDVVILKADTPAPDGSASLGLLLLESDLSTSMFVPARAATGLTAGTKGTLLVDGDEHFLRFTPAEQRVTALAAQRITALAVTGAEGETVSGIGSDTPVYDGETLSTWGKVWVDLPTGARLRFFFAAGGAVEYVFWDGAPNQTSARVLSFEPPAGQNPLPSLGLPADAAVYKNGIAASWADLRRWDVLTYGSGAAVTASSFRITALYEGGAPNLESPETVTTLGGQQFPILPEASVKLGTYALNAPVTFLFTHDRRVADVQPVSALNARQPGVMTGEDTVTLWNGVTVRGRDTNASVGPGEIVELNMTIPGTLSLSPLIQTGGAVPVQPAAGTAGTAPLAAHVLFFDRCAPQGIAASVPAARLPENIPASKVLYVRRDAAGRVELVVLNNVTGDGLAYGFLTYTEGHNASGLDDVYVPSVVEVTGPDGARTFTAPVGFSHPSDGTPVGVKARAGGDVTEIRALTRVTGIRRADFSGGRLLVSGVSLPLPDDMKVYVRSTKTYVTIQEARVLSNDFEVYLDAPVAEGGQARVLVVHA